MEGVVAKIRAKMFFCRFLKLFYSIWSSIFSALELILSRSKIPLPRYKQKRLFAGLETSFTPLAFLFLPHWRLFRVNRRYRCNVTGKKVSFIGIESGFTVFAVLFLPLWRIFLVDQRYRFQDTGENFHSTALKPVLRHSLYYFQHFRSYFESIESTIAKIHANMFFYRRLNRFYDIHCSNFTNLDFILS